MITAATRKSLTDITRRRARACFTVLTLALAVASIWIFAVSSLLQRSMGGEIAHTRLADLTLTMTAVPLDAARLRTIAHVPNVAGVQAKSLFSTRVLVDGKRRKAMIVGIDDFARQPVDVITITQGAAPADGTLATDLQNARRDKFGGHRGDRVQVLAADGRPRSLAISGDARSLAGGSLVSDQGFAVFYASTATVARLSGVRGTTTLALRLRDPSRPAAERTAAAVRRELAAAPGFTGLADYPEIRTPGGYPGKELFEQISTIMTVITFLALLSALMLLSSTMTTLIGEQTAEIAAMKAIGATRRQVTAIFRRTAVLLGALGAVSGAVLGVILSNALAGYFGSRLYGIDAGFHVDAVVLAVSVAVGLAGPPLAALPATRRAGRLPLREALAASGSATGGQGWIDRLVRRAGVLPRSVQLGLGGAGRRKRRTATITAQVALAVGTLLALLALGTAVTRITHAYFDHSRWDVWVQTDTSRPFDAQAGRELAATPGVAEAQPVLTNVGRAAGGPVQVWGMGARAMYRPPLTAGRWYSAADVRAAARAVVIGASVAERAHAGVGDVVRVDTAGGPVPLRVIGITGNENYQGEIVYLPITALQTALHARGKVNGYWLTTTSDDPAAIDHVTRRVEDALGARGHQVTAVEAYVNERDAVAGNRGMTSAITVLGLIIVAISMVGLVNAITMGVIERTREIGMLRCVGARARDVRRIFAVEGMVVAVGGWLAGVPLGYALARGVIALTNATAHIDLAFAFPAGHLVVTLAGTVLLALLALVAPVRRAVRLRPGDALRYA